MPTQIFTFDESTHTYRLGGVVLPSVTQILEGVNIINYDFIPADQRQVYLDRGRRVHTMTHFDDQGDLDESTVDEGDRGYLEAWRKCKADHAFEMAAIEHQQYNPILRYAGTLDRLTKNWWLLDLKSGRTPWWVGMQLSAYEHLLSIHLPRQASVELHDDGTYKFTPIRPAHQTANWASFLAALRVFHVKDRKDGAL